jgi:intracellular septation protein A
MQPQVENATPEEFTEWQQTELNWWADRQLSIVALMSVVQVVVFGLMLLVFYINSKVF